MSAEEVEARRVVGRFFRSLNERRYEQTCALLAHGYFARHPGSRRLCVIGLRVGFLWSQEIRWRISGVWPDGELVVVETVAQGTPGRILLVPSNGRVRVLDVVESGSPRERRPRE